MYLEKINGPKDVKKLDVSELQPLADEVRKAIINKISKVGGHNGPNLGMVEVTVALHYVFNSPQDKLIFDVSHQSYAHKVLTGRKEAFLDEEHFHDVTGYTNPKESEHDIFKIGHTSTSISLALGEAIGRDLKGASNNVVAIIGDGSISGGEALEGLDTAGEYKGNLIIIVNDNDQSIAENHGGIYKSLKALRESNGKASNNIFTAFGLEYHYLDDGHDINKLIALFNSVKDTNHPVVLHIHTIKGKGLKFAEENREAYHAGGPFNIETGEPLFKVQVDTTVFDSLKNLLDKDKTAVVINAGTPMVLGFTKDVREEYVKRGQFIDVGIAEENGVAIASGVAASGNKAVFGTLAPFFQRTYDQVSHDLCLNDNPATMLVLNPGVYGMNSDTHLALADIQMFAHIPNLVYLAPTSTEEYNKMFSFATTTSTHPVGIRVPAKFIKTGIEDETDYSICQNKIEQKGSKVAIFGVGLMKYMALDVASKIKQELDLDITVINPLFLSELDTNLLNSLKENHNLIITLEDGELMGGYGQTVASFYGIDKNIVVKNYGISKKFHTDFKAQELLKENGMDVDMLVSFIKNFLNKKVN